MPVESPTPQTETPTTEIIETSSTDNLKDTFDDIVKEIGQLDDQDKENDEIDIAEGALNGQFAEFLLRPENEKALNDLRRDVNSLKGSWKPLGKKGGQGLDDLATFLDDINDKDRMEKDFDEFMRKIEKPKKLNTLKSWEVRRLNLYLGMNVDDAWRAYDKMKPFVGKFEENNMKSEDIRFFESIWQNLEQTYSKNETFVDKEYPNLANLQPTVASLKEFLKDSVGADWDGSSDKITIKKAENSIVDTEIVKSKVVDKNDERIKNNRTKVEGISLMDKVTDKTKFIKSADNTIIYYKADNNTEKVEFNADKMKELFKDDIKAKVDALEGLEFVTPEEKEKMINSCNEAIFNKFKSELLADGDIQPETPVETETQSETPSSLEYTASPDIIKIKDSALKDKIVELKFCENLEGDVKFNITEVGNYINSLVDKSWRDLRKQPKLEKETWIIAVQIALNHLNTQSGGSYNGKCDVDWLDGIRGPRTKKGVSGFQEAAGIKVDGAPGPETLKKIVEALGVASSGETPPESQTETETSNETPTESPSETPKETVAETQTSPESPSETPSETPTPPDPSTPEHN